MKKLRYQKRLLKDSIFVKNHQDPFILEYQYLSVYTVELFCKNPIFKTHTQIFEGYWALICNSVGSYISPNNLKTLTYDYEGFKKADYNLKFVYNEDYKETNVELEIRVPEVGNLSLYSWIEILEHEDEQLQETR